MLFTRCPSCDTTFRISTDALSKAGGQVRCGRCAGVFDAKSELWEHRPQAEATAARAAGSRAAPDGSQPAAGDLQSAGSAPPAASAGKPGAAPQKTSPPAAESSSAPSALLDALSVSKVIAELEATAVDDADGDDTAPADRSAGLEGDAVGARVDAARWRMLPDEAADAAGSRRWLYASVAAAALLALQLTHHFRADIAGAAVVGPALQRTYALLGSELTPEWDPRQYEIVEWEATAEPKADGRGTLRIAARIRNQGPDAQPYPQIELQLKDRWESSVGSRVFGPEEYLAAGAHADAPMPPGAIASAELEIVDPGPEAYGFEIDVCVASMQGLRCAADAVFTQ